jgi:signal transduction histidine kinase
MRRPDDIRSAPVELAVELGAFERFLGAADDAPSCDPQIPEQVSLALRRAARRVKAGTEFRPACDVFAPATGRVLASVCGAIRQVYTRGRCPPLSSDPLTCHVFDRLRQAFLEEIDRLRESFKPGELCQALRVFDRVREEMDRDETQQFVGALTSGDALSLLLEVAHDMRSPLTSILMLTGMFSPARTRGAGEVQARHLAVVYSAAFGLNALVNDLIALARGGDRLMDPDPVPFSMSELIHSVADIVRPIAEERKLGLRVTTPSIGGRIGHPAAVGRILLNLASNALKYTAVGEVSISAHDVSPEQVLFEVCDTGPGMPADVVPTLFEPFRKQAPSAGGRRFSSTGLGLAICRKLLRNMGGELQLDSVPGQGTRFFFELPLPVAPTSDVARAPSGTSLL